MEPFFVRYRNVLVLLAVLGVQILGLAVQVHKTETGRATLDAQDGAGVRLIRLWAEGLVAPPERLIHNSRLGIAWLWQNYADLRNVRRENQDLQKTVDRLRLEQAQLLEDAREGQRLQALNHFQQQYAGHTLAAQVIGSSGSTQAHVIYLDKGKDAGLEPDMAVITPDGVVGKVREVLGNTAQVLMVNDQTSGAGVILETTRLRGILRGNANGQPMIVGILADQRIQPGEHVITAGGDKVFPRGLAVGVVEKVIRDPERDAFIDILLKPAAHLDQLDEVLVLTDRESAMPAEQQQDIATSQALKGPEVAAEKEAARLKAEEEERQKELQREQQKAAEQMAERLPGLNDPNAKPVLGPDGKPLPPEPPHVQTTPSRAVPALHGDRFSPQGFAAPAPREAAPASTTPKPVGTAMTPKPGTTKPTTTTARPATAAATGTATSTHKPAVTTAKPDQSTTRRTP